MRRIMSRITSQTNHYEVEHEQDPPTALGEQQDLALQVEAELADARRSLARANGWWRIAVSGTTETECLEHAERVITAYARRWRSSTPSASTTSRRSSCPGNRADERTPPRTPLARGRGRRCGDDLHRRRSAGVDHRPGGAGWATPVMYDLWGNMEDFDVAGYYPIVAGLGGGKSNLIGVIIGKTGAAGIPWTASIPPVGSAGWVAPRRCGKHARTLDLVNGHPGQLNTYRLVAEPHPDDFTIHDLAELEDTELAALGVDAEDLGTVNLSDLDPDLVDKLRGRWHQRARCGRRPPGAG